jgi:molybdopterin-guanine dinucleotide biosynthesis protein A
MTGAAGERAVSAAEPTVAAAILAGGQASRYGGLPKGRLEIAPGVSLLARLVGELRAAGLREIVLAANAPEPYLHLGLEIVPDLHPDRGPLGGVEAALSHYGTPADATLFLPCDLPAITSREIVRLREAFLAGGRPVAVCVTGDRLQPLCAVVANALLPEVTAALEAGELSVGRLWRRLGAAEVAFPDPAPFVNLNCPEDLAQWVEGREPVGTSHAARAAGDA